MILARLKASSPYALTTSYLGELVSRKGGILKLKSVVVCYEMLTIDSTGKQNVSTNYISDQNISEDTLEFVEEKDFLFIRAVSPESQILKAYESAINQFRLAKAGLTAPRPAIERGTPLQPGRPSGVQHG